MQKFVGVNGVLGPERLSELSRRSDGPAALYLASHWGAIVATSTAMYFTSSCFSFRSQSPWPRHERHGGRQ